MKTTSKTYKSISRLRNISLFFFVYTLLFSSCSVDDEYNNEPSQSKDDVIRFEIGFAENQKGLRTSVDLDYSSRFEPGDSIGVFAVAMPKTLSSSGNYIHNLKMVYQENNTWLPETPIYYPSNVSGLQFYAYYPYDQSIADPLNMTLAVQADQSSSDNFAKSDVLTAISGLVAKGGVAQLLFHHQMALLVVQVESGAEYARLDESGTVKIENTVGSIGNYSLLLNSGISQTANRQSIKMNRVIDQGNPTKPIYRAYVPFHQYSVSDRLWVSFKQDMTSIYNIPILQFDKSRAYKFNITLKTPIQKHVYRVGDPYPYQEPYEGVVCEVAADGKSGSIVSLDETTAVWSNAPVTIPINEDDGMQNMQDVKMFDPDLQNFPSLKWCASKGEKWYLPALREFSSLFFNLNSINATLSRIGGTPLNTIGPITGYWTSSSLEAYTSSIFVFDDPSTPRQSVYNQQKRVRAISKF